MLHQKEKVYLPNADLKIIDLVVTYFSGSKSVLDLGCGSGGNSAALQGAGFKVTGITLSQKEAAAARQICTVFVCDLEKGLPSEITPGYCDVVVAAHLLEHIFYPDQLLANIRQIANDGVVIVIPNLLFWKNRLKMFFGKFEYADLGIMDYTHSRWYTFKTIQDLLVQKGFVIKSATATGGLFGSKGCIKYKIDNILLRLFPGLFGFQFYIVASKE